MLENNIGQVLLRSTVAGRNGALFVIYTVHLSQTEVSNINPVGMLGNDLHDVRVVKFGKGHQPLQLFQPANSYQWWPKSQLNKPQVTSFRASLRA